MNNQALYLKWRPQRFDDVIGQDHITATLRNSLRQERVRHAYLFSGPRGTGKTTTARLLSKAVNCLHPTPDERPCDECRSCHAIAKGQYFDLIEIDAASHTSVDDVRDLREKIAFAPSEGQYKVYIIDEVHRFSSAAFDALLKTLEEPPAHAIFVLATTELDKVPATIKSRCLLFEFRRVSVREVVNRLRMICDDENISIDDDALELIARQGTGSVRDSISLLDQVIADPDQHVDLEIAQHMLGAVGSEAVQQVVDAVLRLDAPLALDALNEAMDMGADPRQFGQQIVEFLRQIMLIQIGGMEAIDAADDRRRRLEVQASQAHPRHVLQTVQIFNQALNDLKGGWQPQLPLELAIVESARTMESMPQMPVQAAPPPPIRTYEAPVPHTQEMKPAPSEQEHQSTAEDQSAMVDWINGQKGPLMGAVRKSDSSLLPLVKNLFAIGYENGYFQMNAGSGYYRRVQQRLTRIEEEMSKFFDRDIKIQLIDGGDKKQGYQPRNAIEDIILQDGGKPHDIK